ncbi:TetR/AcrR family transcriptional regulator [Microbacterium sp. CJ88]|uniref:TetR/AcrR family transcriptional regulator n=1 Tax=Microbacterium sp. CJ88 TaxID=3445672 RepID=UPI003F660359
MPAPRTSHLRLYAAVLELAADRPVAELTATELARRAGVHRSTFYEHAASPDALLALALRTELDEIRVRHLGDPRVEVGEAVVHTTRAVLAHVEAHEAIYRRGLLEAADGGVRGLLSAHFRDSLRMLEDTNRLRPPFSTPGADGTFALEATARFVAHGSVGLLEAWLDEPAPRDAALYLDAFAALTTGLISSPAAR